MADPPGKSFKKNEDDLICPINLTLPIDPVMAEDGLVYERQAIEKFFQFQVGQELLSPITRQKIGRTLIPAIQFKKIIATLIDNGTLTGDLAEEWRKGIQKKQDVENLLRKAESGDIISMLRVAKYHGQGSNGFPLNLKEAYSWHSKLHALGHTHGTARMGNSLLLGIGVEKDTQSGLVLVSAAAAKGSKLAACILGMAFANGQYGLTVNRTEACQYFEQALSFSPSQKNLSTYRRTRAQRKLAELQRQS